MVLPRLIGWAMSHPQIYEKTQLLLGSAHSHDLFVNEFVGPSTDLSILDLGCGVGSALLHMAPAQYLGIDLDAGYIERAKAKFRDRGVFIQGDVSKIELPRDVVCSCAMAYGLLHHLNDEQVVSMLRLVSKHVRGGRFISIDPVKLQKSHPIADFLIRLDRGQYVRTEEQYLTLLKPFGLVHSVVRTDLLNVPYTHLAVTLQLQQEERLVAGE